jgi:hypothetical protein
LDPVERFRDLFAQLPVGPETVSGPNLGPQPQEPGGTPPKSPESPGGSGPMTRLQEPTNAPQKLAENPGSRGPTRRPQERTDVPPKSPESPGGSGPMTRLQEPTNAPQKLARNPDAAPRAHDHATLPGYVVPKRDPVTPYFAPTAERNFTFMIGIPVGHGEGLVHPLLLNEWAQRARLYQYWEIGGNSTLREIGGNSTLTSTYRSAIATTNRSPTNQTRSQQELPDVISLIRKLNDLPETGPIGPGVYKGPFIFGARNAQPRDNQVADSEKSTPSSQITVSILKSTITPGKRSSRSCPTFGNFSELLPNPLPDSDVLVTKRALLDPNKPALQFVQLTNDQWTSFRNSFPNQRVVIGGYPIRVHLSDAPLPRSQQQLQLSAPDKAALQRIAARPQTQHPTLIVFDDSWPRTDPPAFRRSMQYFCSAFDTLWQQPDIPDFRKANPSTGQQKCIAAMLNATQPLPPVGFTCNEGDCRTHAEKIRESLLSFENAGSSDPVNVVYIPFNAAQKYAWNLLFRLIQWSAMKLPPETWPERLQTAQEKVDASGAFDEMIPAVYSGIQTKLVAGQQIQTSNLLLLESLLIFSREYSRITHQPIFLNLSWTFVDSRHDLSLGNDGLNMVFAAAGDDCNPNPTDAQLACHTDYRSYANALGRPPMRFAADTHPPTRVAAIMDLDARAVPECLSTRIRAEDLGVGYFGNISTDCGSSFASPRAAWLFALYLSRTKPVLDADDFGTRMRAAIRGESRCSDPIADDYSCMELNFSYLESLIQREN